MKIKTKDEKQPQTVVIKCKGKRKRAAQEKQRPKEDFDTSDLITEDLDGLGWKSVEFPMDNHITDDNAGGFTMLEELDGIDVFYEDGPSGKIAKFRKLDSAPSPKNHSSKKEKKQKNIEKPVENKKKSDELPDDVKYLDMSAWSHWNLHADLIKGLQSLRFQTPTEIQSKVLPHAICKFRDIIGAAETGSGKTLAFGLPILDRLLKESPTFKSENGLAALVLAPTRELAIQIKDHLEAVSKYTDIKIMAVLGGMSIDKQKRLLAQKPDIIVATPGRFWQWISEEDSGGFLSSIYESVRFLVIDEADRMIEKGHFKDLDEILRRLEKPKVVKEWNENFDIVQVDEKLEEKLIETEFVSESTATNRQTFVFSATIQFKEAVGKSNKKTMDNKEENLDKLMRKIKFKDEEPILIDVTTSSKMAKTLKETRIECMMSEKDAYLYYFLLRYPGRTLVFVNTIDCIRRLLGILSFLQLPAYGLHAQMQQRQRLKNLDRFKEMKNCVLVASDVASRGLDIPNIDHVIHYQLPKTSELYIHRSGRTARAQQDGISVMLYCPEEIKSYKMICNMLKKENAIPMFEIEQPIVNQLSKRVDIAQELARITQTSKKKHDTNTWLKKMASEMDMELDEDFLSGDDEGKEGQDKNEQAMKIMNLKSRLKQMIMTPILTHGYGSSYVSGSRAQRLLDSLASKASLPTVKMTSAFDEIPGGK